MSTETDLRKRNGPSHRLIYAVLDILTGEVEARVEHDVNVRCPRWTFKVERVKTGIQDD